MCSVCSEFEERMAAGTVAASGDVAQVVERVHGMDEARGSSPRISTLRELSFTIGGLVAAEGSFIVTTGGSFRRRHAEASLRVRDQDGYAGPTAS
jgi:hypothetical protein